MKLGPVLIMLFALQGCSSGTAAFIDFTRFMVENSGNSQKCSEMKGAKKE